MPLQQSVNENYYFAVFDESNKKLLYTKYNFNFTEYIKDFKDLTVFKKYMSDKDDKTNYDYNDKNIIFYDFILRNGHTFDKKFFVKDDLKKYFTAMTNEIIAYHNKYGYAKQENYMWGEVPENFVSQEEYVAKQFELINYDNNQLRRLQDYIYFDGDNCYTKYNFDFDKYSVDYNVWGTKLVIFTDFVIRTTYLNNTFISAYGYGLPLEAFKKYFLQDANLKSYLNNYSVSSTYSNVDKSLPTIDWPEYIKLNTDLVQLGAVDNVIEHFYNFAQFERRKVVFIKKNNKIEKLSNAIVTVVTPSSSA
jgi:hypothetical protein